MTTRWDLIQGLTDEHMDNITDNLDTIRSALECFFEQISNEELETWLNDMKGKDNTMQFKTHNQKHVAVHGTSLQGYVNCDYAKLKKLFGKPNTGDQYKIDAEWDIEFPDGLVATIYNWKDGKNYNGKDGTPKTQITEWHIGGKSEEAVNRVFYILNGV